MRGTRHQAATLVVVLAAAVIGGGLPAPAVASVSVPPTSTHQVSTQSVSSSGQYITLNPTFINFGTVMPSSGAQPAQAIIVRAGSATLPNPNFENMTITGANAGQFYVTTTTCRGQTSSCYVYVTFVPDNVAGTHSASLLFYDDANGSPQVIPLSATVTAAGVTLNPATLAFGNVLEGTTSVPLTETITSSGTGPLNITGLAFLNTTPYFNITNDTCTGKSLTPSASCTFQVTFTPNYPGAYAAQVEPVDNAAPCGCKWTYLIGTGTGPVIVLPPQSAFGGLNVGVTRTAKLPVQNIGNTDLIISSDAITGANPTNFVISTDSCSGATVHPNGSCEVDVTAHATAAGASYGASLSFSDNAPGSNLVTLTVQGVNASDSFSTGSLNFGLVPMSSSVALPITVNSNGPDPLSFSGTTISGPDASEFYVTPNTCGGSVPASTTCTITVNFTSSFLVGFTRSATLTVFDSTGSHAISLTATVNGPGFSFSSNPLSFGTVAKGSPVTLSQTLTNSGNASMTLSQFTNLPGSEYTTSNDLCSNVTLPPSASCSFSVTFNPCCNGDRSAFFYAASGSLQYWFRVVGTGMAPTVVVNQSVNFPNTPWHTTSAPQTLVFKNAGTQSWNVSSVSVADAVNFGVVNGSDHCSGSVVAPNGTCTVDFVFSPTLAQPMQTNVNVNSSSVNFGTVVLSGNGIAPWAGMAPGLALGSYELTFSSPPVAIPVRNIQEAPLHVTGVNFTGSGTGFSLVSQTCQNVPRGGACVLNVQFAPTQVGPAAKTMTLVDDEAIPESVSLSGTGLVHATCTVATLSASPAPRAAIGSTVVFYAGASPCALPLYQFELLAPGGGAQVMQPYSTSSTWSWNTTGYLKETYYITVQVHDASSGPGQDTATTVAEVLDTLPCGPASLTADHSSPQVIGATVVLSASTSQCSAPTFQFWLLSPGSSTWVVGQAYSPSSSFIWPTAGMPAGLYHFIVWARDATSSGISGNSQGRWDGYGSMQFRITSTPTCTLASSSALPANAMAGQGVTVAVGDRGCSNPQFEFWMLWPGSSTWQDVQPYSVPPGPGNGGFIDWNTTGQLGGVYHFTIWTKDAASPGIYGNSLGRWDDYTSFTYVLIPNPCTGLNISPSVLGPTLYISAQAIGCASPRYEFWVLYPHASKWKLWEAYSPNPNMAPFQFNTPGHPFGTYYFSVWARDSSSTGVFSSSYGRWDFYGLVQATFS